MKLRTLLAGLVVTYLAICAVWGPSFTPNVAAGPGNGELFDPVFDIMNRLPEDKGCYGCHVGPKPAIGFWFGGDRDSVLATLQTGINPNGEDLGLIPLEGGRESDFGRYVRNGIMPLGGTPWEEKELAIMDAWLITYEPPPHPFDAVFDIMNRPRAEKGCVGCHIGPRPSIGFWFGADRDAVLATLETGINPNGEDYGFPFVEGGRVSVLGAALHQGRMPRGGKPWTKKDLTLLDDWLLIYE